MKELRAACADVAERAWYVQIDREQIPLYAISLPVDDEPWPSEPGDAGPHPTGGPKEQVCAYWVTLDAINFGSGWFPTLQKRKGRSGYYTVAAGVREWFERHGHWSAAQLQKLDADVVARALGQDPHHQLMRLFAHSLRDLGAQLQERHSGKFTALVESADGSAVELAMHLGEWDCFNDVSRYDELEVPFYKRAQIAAADLARAGMAQFRDLDELTMFADNLVPHVLRMDGLLRFDPELVARIDRGELIIHGSREEVEIRACALHAVELIVMARPRTCAAQIDQLLWVRGQQPLYKNAPRHRCRCAAY